MFLLKLFCIFIIKKHTIKVTILNCNNASCVQQNKENQMDSEQNGSKSWQIFISEWTFPLRAFVYSFHNNATSSIVELAWEPFFILMCFPQHTHQVPKIETSFNYVKNSFGGFGLLYKLCRMRYCPYYAADLALCCPVSLLSSSLSA